MVFEIRENQNVATTEPRVEAGPFRVFPGIGSDTYSTRLTFMPPSGVPFRRILPSSLVRRM